MTLAWSARACALLLGLAACTGDPDGGGADAVCDGQPVTTWDNFGSSFLTENCDICHAASTANRFGAPEDVHFDTVDEVRERVDRILPVATGDVPSMPPEGGVDEDDRKRFEVWLLCWIDQEGG